MSLKAPFPWFGGKSRIAPMVWEKFGDVPNYVEPFAGSLAVLLGRPHAPDIETVNDKDGFISNFWRAVKADPSAVAKYAGYPVFENDLHARHAWLITQKENLVAKLEGDPDYYDSKIAGWWVWGVSCWIGGGFCSGEGPWTQAGGLLVKKDAGQGVNRNLPHLGSSGRGVKRRLPHLGDAGQGVNRQRPHLGNTGQGVNRKRPHIGGSGLLDYFEALQARLSRVRVCSGDWARIMGPAVYGAKTPCAVFLDPPYSDKAGRCKDIYAEESESVAHDVRAWAIENGENPKLRIALCGYDTEHEMPKTWLAVPWKTNGGYANNGTGNGRKNKDREMVWFSPHCLGVSRNYELFDEVEA